MGKQTAPHTIGGFRALIQENIIKYWNAKSTASLSANIKCEKLWPEYENAMTPTCPYPTEEQAEAFADAVRQMEEEGLIKATWIDRILVKASVTETQVSRMADERGILLKAEFYDRLMQATLDEWGEPDCPQLRQRITEDTSAFVRWACQCRSGTMDELETAMEGIQTLCRCIEATYKNEEDILERNFSMKLGLGSKGFAHLKHNIAAVLAGTSAETKGTENDVLKEYHILQNPPKVGVRGNATFLMKDGGTVSLAGKGAIYIERAFFDAIELIDTNAVFSVENLTTFNSLPFPDDGLVVFTEGYPNLLVTDLLEKAVRDNGLLYTHHCGDMDAYGFKILKNIAEKVPARVCSFRMGLLEYEAHKSMAIDMSKDNREELEAMLGDEFFTDAEKQLFVRLLEDEKILEQESLCVEMAV